MDGCTALVVCVFEVSMPLPRVCVCVFARPGQGSECPCLLATRHIVDLHTKVVRFEFPATIIFFFPLWAATVRTMMMRLLALHAAACVLLLQPPAAAAEASPTGGRIAPRTVIHTAAGWFDVYDGVVDRWLAQSAVMLF